MEDKITLIHPTTGAEHEFSAEHAERILNMPGAGGGWKRKKTTGKKTSSAAKKRDTKTTGSKAATDDDCGCNQS